MHAYMHTYIHTCMHTYIHACSDHDIRLELTEPGKGHAVLGGETKLKMTFLGSDGADVRLTKAVVREQKDLVRAIFGAQQELGNYLLRPGEPPVPRMVVSQLPDYYLSGTISTKELTDQLAIVFKIQVLTEVEYFEVEQLPPPPGHEPRPKASQG